MDKRGWAIRYTTAEADYDWMGTERLGVAGHDAYSGKPWWKIRIDPKYVQTQTDRYMSGVVKPCITQAQFNELIRLGLVRGS